MKQTAILVYETGQINALVRFLSQSSEEEKEKISIIAFGADIEFALEKLGLMFISGIGLRSTSHFERLVRVEKLGREVLDDATFSFFSYRGVPLTNVFMPILQVYLTSLLYFIDVATTFVEKYPQYTRIAIFPSSNLLFETSGVLAPQEASAAVDAVRIVGEKYNLEISVLEMETNAASLHARMSVTLFNLKRRLFGWGLFVLNTFVVITLPKKGIRILASEYWRNISPLMSELPEGELLLLDRGESRKAGLHAIWKHRMRFIHIDNFVSRGMSRTASMQMDTFVEKWEQAQNKNSALQKAQFRGHSLTSVLAAALQRIVERGGKQAIRTINGSYVMYEKTRPDIVLVRASVSGQIHFSILCHVAAALGIPSLEVQHGIFYLGEGSYFKRRSAEYIAEYGPRLREGFKKIGYMDNQLFDTGSPRFDGYIEQAIQSRPKSEQFVIAVILPGITVGSSDSYEILDFLSGIADAVTDIPNALILFSLRGEPNEVFFREAIALFFSKIPHRIANNQSLINILNSSDVVISGHSTSILESLAIGKPTIFYAELPIHALFGKDLGSDFATYAKEGALFFASNTTELTHAVTSLATSPEKRESLTLGARLFMDRNYSFDGRSSGRLADTVRLLVAKPVRPK